MAQCFHVIMNTFMSAQMSGFLERLPAQNALMRPLPCMRPLVTAHHTTCGESLVAMTALIWPFTCVYALMHSMTGSGRKALRTKRAFIRALSGV